MATDARVVITLACNECKARNYTTSKNKRTQQEKRLELRKFCKVCRKHTVHREAK